MLTKIRVAIVAAAPLAQAELRAIVASAAELELACVQPTLQDLRVALARAPRQWVDVAIVDRPARTTGADDPLLEYLEAGQPAVVLTDMAPGQDLPWLEAGATCLPLDATAQRIRAAAAAAAAGLVALPAEHLPTWCDEVARRAARATRAFERLEPLTVRELQVLERLAAGRANRAIARELGISEHTAKFHVSRVLGKLAAATRAEAVAIGLREGLIDERP